MSPKPHTPPTLADLAAYAREISAPPTFDPQGFLDYWEARGWYMRPGIRMASWRAAVRTFIRNQRTWDAANGEAATGANTARAGAIRDYAAQAILLDRFGERGQLQDLYAKIRDVLDPGAVAEVRRRVTAEGRADVGERR